MTPPDLPTSLATKTLAELRDIDRCGVALDELCRGATPEFRRAAAEKLVQQMADLRKRAEQAEAERDAMRGRAEAGDRLRDGWVGELITKGYDPEGYLCYSVNRFGDDAPSNPRFHLDFVALQRALREALAAAPPEAEKKAVVDMFRDAAKNCTGEMFGEQAAVKPEPAPSDRDAKIDAWRKEATAVQHGTLHCLTDKEIDEAVALMRSAQPSAAGGEARAVEELRAVRDMIDKGSAAPDVWNHIDKRIFDLREAQQPDSKPSDWSDTVCTGDEPSQDAEEWARLKERLRNAKLTSYDDASLTRKALHFFARCLGLESAGGKEAT